MIRKIKASIGQAAKQSSWDSLLEMKNVLEEIPDIRKVVIKSEANKQIVAETYYDNIYQIKIEDEETVNVTKKSLDEYRLEESMNMKSKTSFSVDFDCPVCGNEVSTGNSSKNPEVLVHDIAAYLTVDCEECESEWKIRLLIKSDDEIQC